MKSATSTRGDDEDNEEEEDNNDDEDNNDNEDENNDEENNDEAQDEDVLHALNEGPGADTSISFYIVSTPSTSRSSTSTIPTPGSRW